MKRHAASWRSERKRTDTGFGSFATRKPPLQLLHRVCGSPLATVPQKALGGQRSGRAVMAASGAEVAEPAELQLMSPGMRRQLAGGGKPTLCGQTLRLWLTRSRLRRCCRFPGPMIYAISGHPHVWRDYALVHASLPMHAGALVRNAVARPWSLGRQLRRRWPCALRRVASGTSSPRPMVKHLQRSVRHRVGLRPSRPRRCWRRCDRSWLRSKSAPTWSASRVSPARRPRPHCAAELQASPRGLRPARLAHNTSLGSCRIASAGRQLWGESCRKFGAGASPCGPRRRVLRTSPQGCACWRRSCSSREAPLWLGGLAQATLQADTGTSASRCLRQQPHVKGLRRGQQLTP
mmetsp:Transcript_81417/g.181845  ORF Transcript_81417/g.181845 Transcript_81417/m.181845 type:complete len:349 (-) Transcript_81417:12-1058(-)